MKKKYHLWVLGCQMNESDAERIDKVMTGLNWQKINSEKEADLIIVVACSVRQSAISHVFGKGYQWRKKRRAGKLKTVLTGCVLEQDKAELSGLFDAILPIAEIGKLPRIIGPVRRKISAPKQLPNYSALVPISNGCDNYCSYCVVPFARGPETCRDADEIIAECRELIGGGCKEITLLGQNVNSYKGPEHEAYNMEHRNKKQEYVNFSTLLKEIDGINGDFWIRFMSAHPKDLSDELIEAMAGCKHLAPQLHLALQSGSDEILKKMNRHYTAKQYIKLIDKVRKKIPSISISTDVIVGFPGETKAQFRQTAELMKKIKFDMAYIAAYSPRPGTAAAKMKDDVSAEEKKRRGLELNEILRRTALENNQRHLGTTVRVLVDGCKKGKCLAKTGSRRVVSFVGEPSMIGKFVAVKIISVKSFGMSGEMV